MRPSWRVVLETGELHSSSYPLSSLTRTAGYGQTLEVSITIPGQDGVDLLENGLKAGVRIVEVWMGFDDSLTLIGKNLLVWAHTFIGDEGDALNLTAYGVSQFLRNSGKRTLKLGAKTYAQVARDVAARHGIPIRIGSSAFVDARELTSKPVVKPAAVTAPTNPNADLTGGLAGAGVIGVSKPSANPKASSAANATRKDILQQNESDWDLLTGLAKQIGYIVGESPLGNELYFGPGLEIGDRPRYVLVRGQYQIDNQPVAPNVASLEGGEDLYGLPSEIVVTGIEGGKRFALIVTPDDLAERHKVQLTPAGNKGSSSGAPASGTTSSNKDLTGGLAGAGVIGVSKTVGGVPRDANGRFVAGTKTTKAVTGKSGAANFAGQTVGALVNAANLPGVRRVIGGASSRLDALERGLETLALRNLTFQEVSVSTAYGMPEALCGFEIILEGDRVPVPMRGLYLIRTDSQEITPEGYSTTLGLARNSS